MTTHTPDVRGADYHGPAIPRPVAEKQLNPGRINHAALLFIIFAWLTIAFYGIGLIALIAMAASASS